MVRGEELVKSLVYSWYERSRTDYPTLYMYLYIAYNAWFRRVTKATSDREALIRLQRRFVIWDDYLRGSTLKGLSSVMKQIATQSSFVANDRDWVGLIRFWYQVRCDLFHGAIQPGQREDIKLAYISLSIFMAEIVSRMRNNFSNENLNRLNEIKTLIKFRPDEFSYLVNTKEALQRKYIKSVDVWQVDMARV